MRVFARISAVTLLILSAMGQASTLKVTADSSILSEETARLPPIKQVAVNVSVEINAPEIGAGRKLTTPPVFGLFALEFPARDMLQESAQACMKRWFVPATGGKNRSIVLSVTLRQFDHALISDVGMWRPTTRADLDVTASDPKGGIILQATFSSDRQLGEWVKSSWGQRFLTKEHQPRYTHMIYRAFLIALDKAMADLVLHVPELRDQISAEEQKRLEAIRGPQGVQR
jgi:hypothetical protein